MIPVAHLQGQLTCPAAPARFIDRVIRSGAGPFARTVGEPVYPGPLRLNQEHQAIERGMDHHSAGIVEELVLDRAILEERAVIPQHAFLFAPLELGDDAADDFRTALFPRGKLAGRWLAVIACK